MAKYYSERQHQDSLHVFKVSNNGILHINVTHLHINALPPGRQFNVESEISEQEFNQHRNHVQQQLDLI